MIQYISYINKIKNLHNDLVDGLEFIQWRDHVSNDSTIFVKPNFTYPFHKPGITTTPELLENLLGILKDKADNVIIGESDGGNRSFSADTAFKGHDMYNIY